MKNVIVILTMLSVLPAILSGQSTEKSKITMNLNRDGNVEIELAGNGTATIDWGDSTTVEILTLSDTRSPKTHRYSGRIDRVINIFGENITEFNCSHCEITGLDVTNNPSLTLLFCSGNYELKHLDVSKNYELKDLMCYGIGITHLDVSKNAKLTDLMCSANWLTHLDVSKNIALTKLNCAGNELKQLDVSNNAKLTDLECSSNSLTHLDVSKNIALTDLHFDSNQLKRLDVSKNPELKRLVCANNQFSATKLNKLFKSLYVNDTLEEKIIIIGGNPGTDKCKRSIAEKKGWEVDYQADFG